MAELKRHVVSYEGGGEMRLSLSSEQASEYRKDPAVASVNVEKEAPAEAFVGMDEVGELPAAEKEKARKAWLKREQG